MKGEFAELSGWTFQTREISPGVYNIRAVHLSRASIDLTDVCDPEILLKRAKESAVSMQEDLKQLDLKRRILGLRRVGQVDINVMPRSNQDVRQELLKLLEPIDRLEKSASEISSRLRETAQSDAQQIVQKLLNRDMAYGGEIMDAETASSLATELISFFGDDAKFFSNVSEEFAKFHEGSVTAYRLDPITSATFNAAIFVVGATSSGLILVEDED